MRSQYRSYYRGGISKEWTPVFAIKRTFYVSQQHIPVIREQFPLRPAAAKTIHKAQGDTLDAIVVDMGDVTNAHAHYVALSRVRNMNGLRILRLNEKKIKVTASVTQEMARLKSDSTLSLCYTPLYTLPDPVCKITFQNARSFHKHFTDLSNDDNILASDVIAIAESRLMSRDSDHEYELGNFTAFRNDQPPESSHVRPPHGQITYIRRGRCEKSSIAKFSDPLLEFSMISLTKPSLVQVVSLYKSPACGAEAFRDRMRFDLLPRLDIDAPFIILGDFNYDLSQEQNEFMSFMHTMFHCRQHVQVPTTPSGTILDLVFTNCDVSYCKPTYCAWSDHKTLCVAL